MTRNTPQCAPSPHNLVSVFMYAHVFLYQREYSEPLVIMTKKNIQYGLPRLISCRTVIITFFAAMSTWRSLHHRPVFFWLPMSPSREDIYPRIPYIICSSIPAVHCILASDRLTLWGATSAVLLSRIEDYPGSFPMRPLSPHSTCLVSIMSVERSGIHIFLSAQPSNCRPPCISRRLCLVTML